MRINDTRLGVILNELYNELLTFFFFHTDFLVYNVAVLCWYYV